MKNLEMGTATAVEMEKLCELLKEIDPVLEREIERAIVRADRVKYEMEYEQSIGKPSLISALKVWRREKAKAEGISSYIIITNIVLLEIARALPATMDELVSIKGFGSSKAEKYGAEILQIVARECEVVG